MLKRKMEKILEDWTGTRGHRPLVVVSQAIKLGDYNVGKEGKVLTLPMYMSFLLSET